MFTCSITMEHVEEFVGSVSRGEGFVGEEGQVVFYVSDGEEFFVFDHGVEKLDICLFTNDFGEV